MRVLYAEDNLGMRKMVTHFLGIAGFEVTITSDGDEAVCAASKEKYDVILLDVTMERLDGINATRIIRNSTNPNQDTRIIGLTGRSENGEISACLEVGMNRVLSKPVDLEALARALTEEIEIEIDEAEEKLRTDRHITVKTIDVDVLEHYARIAGRQSLEGILHDFSDLWPRKIGELFTASTLENMDSFSRSAEELSVIAAGIGAGKVAQLSSNAMNSVGTDQIHKCLNSIVVACNEVQTIINALYGDRKPIGLDKAA